jgi:2-methylisocitrate lyase-like PEP mutase family enzyme
VTAASLRALHVPGRPLVLPNVWDAASARTVEKAGFAAVATSSAAIAAALGYRDGEALPVVEMLDTIARIADAVSVPVTADIERGYGLAPAELVERLAATGAVGCNLEDSDPRTRTMVDPSAQADFLAAVRAAAVHSGLDLVINARVDTFARPDPILEDALIRARLYRAAGADCVFPILAAEPEHIRALVGGVDAPINIMCRPGAPAPAELAALGVARVSFGSGLRSALQAHHRQLLDQILAGDSPYHSGQSGQT